MPATATDKGPLGGRPYDLEREDEVILYLTCYGEDEEDEGRCVITPLETLAALQALNFAGLLADKGGDKARRRQRAFELRFVLVARPDSEHKGGKVKLRSDALPPYEIGEEKELSCELPALNASRTVVVSGLCAVLRFLLRHCSSSADADKVDECRRLLGFQGERAKKVQCRRECARLTPNFRYIPLHFEVISLFHPSFSRRRLLERARGSLSLDELLRKVSLAGGGSIVERGTDQVRIWMLQLSYALVHCVPLSRSTLPTAFPRLEHHLGQPIKVHNIRKRMQEERAKGVDVVVDAFHRQSVVDEESGQRVDPIEIFAKSKHVFVEGRKDEEIESIACKWKQTMGLICSLRCYCRARPPLVRRPPLRPLPRPPPTEGKGPLRKVGSRAGIAADGEVAG